MKKLIALFIVLSLCFSSCTLLAMESENNSGPKMENFPTLDDVYTDGSDVGKDDIKDENDHLSGGTGTGNNTGTGSGDNTDTGSGNNTGTGSGDNTGTGSGNTGTGSGDNTGTGSGNTGTGSGDNTGSGSGNTGSDEGCDDGHTDANDDGVCDYCDISVIVIIDIFSINDIHGKITATTSQPGIGGLTTYLKNQVDENDILLSTGDMWQGSAESNLTYGAFITDWMNNLGFVSMTLGNHEYDWGESYISANAELAEFPLLAINVYDRSTGQRAKYATPSVVVERGGVQIGIIGAIGDCYSSVSGDVSDGFYFKVGSELTSLVKAESDRLKAQGVDFIIYAIHDGYGSSSSGTKTVSNSSIASYYDAALSNGYVDMVFEAHTHQSYILVDGYGVYHLQGSGENKGLSHAEISINSANGNSDVNVVEIITSSAWSGLASDPLVAELLEKYDEQISAADEILGTNRKYLDDSDVEQIVANLYYEAGLQYWGDDYTITLAGGFIRTRNPYNLKAGTVLYSDVYSLLPFDNDLVLCSISGKDLLDKFINTTNSDYYIAAGVDIETLKSTIQTNKTYYVVVDTYTSSYAYNNLTEIARVSGLYARDLFAEYVRDGGLS